MIKEGLTTDLLTGGSMRKIKLVGIDDGIFFDRISVEWNGIRAFFAEYGKEFVSLSEFRENRACYDLYTYQDTGIPCTTEEIQEGILRHCDYASCQVDEKSVNMLGVLSDCGIMTALMCLHDEADFTRMFACRGVSHSFQKTVYGVRGETEKMGGRIQWMCDTISGVTPQETLIVTRSFLNVRSAMAAQAEAILLEDPDADTDRYPRYDFASTYRRITCISELPTLVV